MALVIIQTAMTPEHHQQMLEYIWKDCVDQVNRGDSQLILSAETKNQLGQAGVQNVAGRYAGLIRLSVQVLLDPAFQIVCLRPIRPLQQHLALPCQSPDLIYPCDTSALGLSNSFGSTSHVFPPTCLSRDSSTSGDPFSSVTDVSARRYASLMPEEPVVKHEVPKIDHKRKIAMVKAEPEDIDVNKRKLKIAVDRQNKIPRPANAFILYRQHHHPEVKANHPGMHNNDISKVIGDQWKNEDDDTKASWTEKAEEVKRLHVIEHPDYQYTPRKPSEKKRGVSKKRRVSKKPKPADEPVDDSVTAPFAAAPKSTGTVLIPDMSTNNSVSTTLDTRALTSPSATSFPSRNNLTLTPNFALNLEPIIHEIIVLDDNDYDLTGNAGFAKMLQDSSEGDTDNNDLLGGDKHGQVIGQFLPSPAAFTGPAFGLPAAFANDMSFENYMNAEKSGQVPTLSNPATTTLSPGSAGRADTFFSTAMSSFGHDLGLAGADLDGKSAMLLPYLDNDNQDAKLLEQEHLFQQLGSDSAKDSDFRILFGSPGMSNQEIEAMFFNFIENAV